MDLSIISSEIMRKNAINYELWIQNGFQTEAFWNDSVETFWNDSVETFWNDSDLVIRAGF